MLFKPKLNIMFYFGKTLKFGLCVKKGVMSRENDETGKGTTWLVRVAAFIVDKRMLFSLIYILAVIFSLFSSEWVEVNNSITDYLPASTETYEGMHLMEEEFTTFGSAKVMISNIPFAEAQEVQAMRTT